MRSAMRWLMLGTTAFVWYPIILHAQEKLDPATQAAIDETIAVYCEAWGEANPERRLQMLNRVWDPTATYVDPISRADSRDALIARIEAFQKRYPGARIIPLSHADVHHDMLRFTWRFVLADGSTRNEGIDFGLLASDGRLKQIVGFFGPLTPKP
jgi:hypothetical protein